jgi:hypothetical protein
MRKEKSDLALIVSWLPNQDPTVDLPKSAKWESGKPASVQTYLEHLDDTHRWIDGSSDGPQLIIYPSIIANVRYDTIAGTWAVSGRGVPYMGLNLTDPNAPDDVIIAELSTYPTVFRAQIKRSSPHGSEQTDPATVPVQRTSVSLYWIASLEKKRDWLVFAHTMTSAAAFHRDEFHGTIDSRHCRRVLQHVRPFPFYSGEAPCYATNDDLVQLGFRALESPAGIQAVRLGIATYVEGYQFSAIPEIRDDNAEAASGNRPSGTKRYLPPLHF